MKNYNDILDAFREEWHRYGENLDLGPSPELTFADGPAVRPLPAILLVVWLLITAAAVRWMPSADYYNVIGSDAPEVAISCVQSILEIV